MTLSFHWIIQIQISPESSRLYIQLYKGHHNEEQSVRNLGYINKLEFIALYLDIFTLVKSHELLTISMDKFRKLCRLELKDILIQQEFNFIGNEPNHCTENEKDIYFKGFNYEHSGQL